MDTNDPTLFDLDAGRAARNEGMQLATDAKETWTAEAASWIRSLRPGQTFTTDDLILWVGLPEGVNNKAVGGVVGGLAKGKPPMIRNTGQYVQTERATSHARRIAVWERL